MKVIYAGSSQLLPKQQSLTYFKVFLSDLSSYSSLSALHCFWFTEFWHVFRLLQRTGPWVFFSQKQPAASTLAERLEDTTSQAAPCGVEPLAFPDVFTFFSSCSLLEGVSLNPLGPWPSLRLPIPMGADILYPCRPLRLLGVGGSPCLPLSSASFLGHAHCLSGSHVFPFLFIVSLCKSSSSFQTCSLGICPTYRPSGTETPPPFP